MMGSKVTKSIVYEGVTYKDEQTVFNLLTNKIDNLLNTINKKDRLIDDSKKEIAELKKEVLRLGGVTYANEEGRE